MAKPALEIELDRTSAAYCAGEQVTGHLSIDVASGGRVNQAEVEILQTVGRDKKVLAVEFLKVGTLGAGTHQIPFSIRFPAHAFAYAPASIGLLLRARVAGDRARETTLEIDDAYDAPVAARFATTSHPFPLADPPPRWYFGAGALMGLGLAIAMALGASSGGPNPALLFAICPLLGVAMAWIVWSDKAQDAAWASHFRSVDFDLEPTLDGSAVRASLVVDAIDDVEVKSVRIEWIGQKGVPNKYGRWTEGRLFERVEEFADGPLLSKSNRFVDEFVVPPGIEPTFELGDQRLQWFVRAVIESPDGVTAEIEVPFEVERIARGRAAEEVVATERVEESVSAGDY